MRIGFVNEDLCSILNTIGLTNQYVSLESYGKYSLPRIRIEANFDYEKFKSYVDTNKTLSKLEFKINDDMLFINDVIKSIDAVIPNYIGYKGSYQISDIIIDKQKQTVVKWTDGDVTVVRCNDADNFCPEIGLAMAISKKIFGDSYKNKMSKLIKSFDDKHKYEIEKKRAADREKKLAERNKKENE